MMPGGNVVELLHVYFITVTTHEHVEHLRKLTLHIIIIEENNVDQYKSDLLLMIFRMFIINYNS
jgi:hypothetical protein